MSGSFGTNRRMRIFCVIISICISFSSGAQLCSGSLGDPAINITFGQGGNTGTGFSPPGYTYTSSTCPNDGFYTITAATAACFSSSWHTVNADHTGNGNFMLVNASNQPADFFVANLTGLCPATTYEFSSWIMNVLLSPAGIKPNITFTVETPSGTILNQFNTGDIDVSPQPLWKQYGFFFTTTAGNPAIVLRMRNNAPGGNGNDLALDDISFRPCGPVLTSSIQGNPPVVNICAADQLLYTMDAIVSPGFITPVFQWQLSKDSGATWNDIPGAVSLQYQRPSTTAGNYWYRLTVAESGNGGITACRIVSNTLIINVYGKPVINAGPDRLVIAGSSTVMTATATGDNINYNWSPPDYLSSTSTLNPVVTTPVDMTYILSAVSPFGCTNEDAVEIKVVAGIFVPTAFTPDNNGRNDSWRIPFLDPQLGATVSVYNRWGQLLYQVSETEVNWDGTYKGAAQPAGTYIYHIRFKEGFPDMKGTFVLIR